MVGDDGVADVRDLAGLAQSVVRQDLAKIFVQRLDLSLQVDVVLADLVAGTLNLSEFLMFDVCHVCVLVGG